MSVSVVRIYDIWCVAYSIIARIGSIIVAPIVTFQTIIPNIGRGEDEDMNHVTYEVVVKDRIVRGDLPNAMAIDAMLFAIIPLFEDSEKKGVLRETSPLACSIIARSCKLICDEVQVCLG